MQNEIIKSRIINKSFFVGLTIGVMIAIWSCLIVGAIVSNNYSVAQLKKDLLDYQVSKGVVDEENGSLRRNLTLSRKEAINIKQDYHRFIDFVSSALSKINQTLRAKPIQLTDISETTKIVGDEIEDILRFLID